MKQVLMFGWELPPRISGGLGTACYGLTRALALGGHARVRFVLPKEIEDEDGSHVELVGLRVQKAGTGTALPKAYGTNLMAAALGYAAQVERHTALLHDVAIIHAHDWLTVPAAIAAQRATGRPMVLHVHSTEFDRSVRPDPAIVAIERAGMDHADLIVAVSARTAQTIGERYGQVASKVAVVHNGIESPAGTQVRSANPGLVSFIGRVTYQKGPAYFIDAAALALQKVPTLRFVLAGDGDLLPAMRERARRLGIERQVVFPGFLCGDEVAHLLARSAAYVMPSVSEPFGIGALEAAAASVPVIVSRQCGMVEAVQSVHQVDYNDAAAIAQAMLDITQCASHAASLAAAALGETRALTWARAADAIGAAYAALAGGAAMRHAA